MERFADKLIVAACCALALPVVAPPSMTTIVAALLALTATALYEAFQHRNRAAVVAPLAFAASTIIVPAFAVFLPLTAYDCLREDSRPWHFIWLIALPFACAQLPLYGGIALCISCSLACLLSRRTSTILHEREDARRMRDNLQEASLAIESKNRDLQESQDMQVRLATLTERGRIAREIHDNVGHLLTRAIMQVEALQVVHADDPRIKADFNDVSTTLHEAMDEVRASVHDLRDESIDVCGQLQAALDGCGIAHSHLDYQMDEVPANIGYCFLAVTREALSNTARHTDATSVEVAAMEHPGIYQLSIWDNGSQPPSPPTEGGMGLATMESRVRALQGTFRTEFQNGFHVFASIPKTAQSSASATPPAAKTRNGPEEAS